MVEGIIFRMRAKTATLCQSREVFEPEKVSDPVPILVISVRPERQPIRPPYDDDLSRNRRSWRDSHGRRGRNRRVDHRTAKLARQTERLAAFLD